MIPSARLKGTVSHNDFILKEPPALTAISLLGLTDSDSAYASLVNEIRSYNQRLATGSMSETYEHSVYQQLANILKNVKEGDVERQKVLSDTQQWYDREQRKI